jgi:hypothetical protein
MQLAATLNTSLVALLAPESMHLLMLAVALGCFSLIAPVRERYARLKQDGR